MIPATVARGTNRPTTGGEPGRGRTALAWLLLGAFLFLTAAARAVYSAHETEPSSRFQVLSTIGLLVLLWYWFMQQCQRHRPSLPLDLGIFLACFWFALIPYYMWRFERWRGLAKVAGLFGLFLVAHLASIGLYLILARA